jgi:hypothetical protein
MADKHVRSAAKTADTADRISVSFARQLSAVLRQVERRIRDLLTQEATPARSVQVQASQAYRVRNQLQDILLESGYGALVDEATGAALDRMVERVLVSRRIARVSYDLAPEARLLLEAMRSLHLGDLLDEGQVILRAITQAVSRGLFGAQPVSEILPAVSKVLDISEARVATLYDTAVSIYGRQVEAVAAGNEGDTRFLYAGPVDEATRDFCLEHVGRVLTRDEIDELDNGQIANVFLTGGGYNCRHVWMEVSRFSELYDLDEGRVPEVQQQLDELEQAA